MKQAESFDVVIIGGSYSGLAAALALGRAVRSVLVVDSRKPCNAQTPHSHNFLTQDGNTPAAIANLAREQVLQYPTITFIEDKVVDAQGSDLNFTVELGAGEFIQAKKLLFTTGIKDLFPAIKGLAQCWGISVIHCPYCHGYEYRDQPTGILINGEGALEMARLISNWTKDLTIFTNGASTITEEDQTKISALGIEIVVDELAEIMHENGYLNCSMLKNGQRKNLNALYARLPFEQHCTVPEEMGCEMTDKGYIQVNGFQQTSVPGVYAAGDNTTMMRSLTAAVSSGTMAGVSINRDLIFN